MVWRFRPNLTCYALLFASCTIITGIKLMKLEQDNMSVIVKDNDKLLTRFEMHRTGKKKVNTLSRQ